MSNDEPSPQDSSIPRPAWLLPLAVGVGFAVGISVLGSLLLVVVWLFTADRTATEVISNGETTSNAIAQAPSESPGAAATESPSPAPPAIETAADDSAVRESPAVAVTAVPPAASATTEETNRDAPPVEPRPTRKPIRFDDVPVIGGQPEPSAAVEEPKEETPEKLDVPFYVLGCVPSTDGRLVAVWGYEPPNEDELVKPARDREQRPPDSRLTLIEVAMRKEIASRSIDAVITQVDVNATGVYVTANEDRAKMTMSVLRLSTEDLQSLDRTDILMGTITSIADQFLISADPDDRARRKYHLPGLQPADLEPAPTNRRTTSAPSRRLADGWLLDGVLWDEVLKTPKLLSTLPDFHPVLTNQSRAGGIVAVPILQGYVTHAASGKPPSERDWRLERTRYSPHVPAILSFSNNRGQTSLEFVEHYTGKIVRSVVLASGTPSNVSLATAPDWIFVTLNGDAMVLPAQSKQAPIAFPFRIEPRQSTLVLSPGTPIQVRYQAADATKFEFEVPGLTLDGRSFKQQSPTGEFTIDTTADVPLIVKAMNETATKVRRSYNGDITAWAESYVEQIRPQFVRLTGREPTGVPLTLDAYVRAYSKDLSIAVLHHIYLIEIPLAEFEQYRRPAPTPLAAATNPRPSPAASQPTPKPVPAPTAPSAALRTWTDTQGRTIQAKFVQVDGEVAVVIDSQGRTLRIPLDRLSERDRDWVAEQAARSDQPLGDER